MNYYLTTEFRRRPLRSLHLSGREVDMNYQVSFRKWYVLFVEQLLNFRFERVAVFIWVPYWSSVISTLHIRILPSGYGYGTGFRGFESTNELWIRGCRSWLYVIGIGSRGAFLLSRFLWGLSWLWCWLWCPRPWAHWFEWGEIHGYWYSTLGIDGFP